MCGCSLCLRSKYLIFKYRSRSRFHALNVISLCYPQHQQHAALHRQECAGVYGGCVPRRRARDHRAFLRAHQHTVWIRRLDTPCERGYYTRKKVGHCGFCIAMPREKLPHAINLAGETGYRLLLRHTIYMPYRHLLIVGNRRTLARNELWSQILDYCKGMTAARLGAYSYAFADVRLPFLWSIAIQQSHAVPNPFAILNSGAQGSPVSERFPASRSCGGESAGG